MKGQFQLIPIIVASIIGLAVTAFTLSSLASSLPKIAFIGIGLFSAFFAFQRMSQRKSLDNMTLILLITAFLFILFAVAGMKLLGLQSIVPV